MEGKCLCGLVHFIADEASELEACHCSTCRRWGGGPFLAVHCASGVVIKGEASVKRFASSEWAERAFCNECGTHLFYYLKPADEYIVPVGLFGDGDNFEFKQQIFIDKKPAYYTFENQTESLTEAEVFAKYGQ